MTTSNKTLYFEGAGWNFHEEENFHHSDVGNFRIRTSFLNNEGKQIYFEVSNGIIYDKKGKKVNRYSLVVEFCFEIPSNKEDRIEYDKFYNRREEHLATREHNYTKKDIVKWINERFNMNFDTMEVLDEYYGYRVFGDFDTYNLMEDIELDHQRAKARKEAFEAIDKEYRQHTNEKYSIITLSDMDDENITIKSHATNEKLNGLPRIQKILIN